MTTEERKVEEKTITDLLKHKYTILERGVEKLTEEDWAYLSNLEKVITNTIVINAVSTKSPRLL